MLTRRTFVVSSAAAALAPRMALAASRTDVVVIGAGLAGMNAAMMLREQGYKVVVLEADSRVGGRVETVDTVDGPLDVGASQIGRGYARVLDMCQRLNLKLIPEDRDLLDLRRLSARPMGRSQDLGKQSAQPSGRRRAQDCAVHAGLDPVPRAIIRSRKSMNGSIRDLPNMTFPCAS